MAIDKRKLKENYKIGMERISYELSLDYGNKVEKILGMDSLKEALQSAGK